MIWLPPRKKILTSRHKQRGNIVVTIAEGQDPFFGDVVFLMDCEETTAGQTIITPTVGPTMQAFTASGGFAEVSNAQAKFGDQSIFTDDTGGLPDAYWSSPATFDQPDFNLAAQDFTLETHIRWQIAQQNHVVMSKWHQGTGNRQWRWEVNPTTLSSVRIQFIGSSNGTSNNLGGFQKIIPGTLAIDTWYHMAMTRDGNELNYWFEGVLVGQDDATGFTFFNSVGEFNIMGSDNAGGGSYEDYLDNMRITVGAARYTAPGPFTPPDAPYPAF